MDSICLSWWCHWNTQPEWTFVPGQDQNTTMICHTATGHWWDRPVGEIRTCHPGLYVGLGILSNSIRCHPSRDRESGENCDLQRDLIHGGDWCQFSHCHLFLSWSMIILSHTCAIRHFGSGETHGVTSENDCPSTHNASCWISNEHIWHKQIPSSSI